MLVAYCRPDLLYLHLQSHLTLFPRIIMRQQKETSILLNKLLIGLTGLCGKNRSEFSPFSIKVSGVKYKVSGCGYGFRLLPHK